MIENVAQAEQYLARFYEKVRQTTGANITVDRMWPLLELAGNPQETLRVVHVAGTSGKTSTSYFVAELLKQAGVNVGLTVSPHISSITERLQLGGKPVSDAKFCDYFNEFMEIMGEDPDASYFEYLIVFALWVFSKEGVDYAVLETGLGGLHDGTNVCRRADKICVITDIGLDHQNVLGDDIASIAAQKAGIIHHKNEVFMFAQVSEVMTEVTKRVGEVGAHLNIVEEDMIQDSQLVSFQFRNWSLARQVCNFLIQRDDLCRLSLPQLQASQVSVPGRMQVVTSKDQTFVLDGAHNAQKMEAFVSSFMKQYPDCRVPIILAVKEGKDYPEVIRILRPIMDQAFCVSFERLQDMKHHSIDPELLVAECKKNGVEAKVVPSLQDAIMLAKQTKEPVIVATGSFYVLGDILQLLKM